MHLSITSDYAKDTGDPEPYLRRIADAGFTHVHWCHHWNTDFLYSRCEIAQIARWFSDFGLKLLDLHASAGQEKHWASGKEYERRAGVELVKNRITMAAQLGADVIIMHIPGQVGCAPLRRSLAALQRPARAAGVRIAIENGEFAAIRAVFDEFGPEYLGLCYDAGHGNLIADGLDQLAALNDRLISVHLHDNNRLSDQHKLLFSGTVDWARLARIMAASAYKKCVSMEVVMRNETITDEAEFLAQAYATGTRFAQMLAAAGFDNECRS